MSPHAVSPPSSQGINTPEPASPHGSSNGESGLGGMPIANHRTVDFLPPVHPDELHDLICVGFGPASLAIAIAMHDHVEAHPNMPRPKIAFLEKQASFAWHSGMQLPGTTMQISWIKDFATLRNPRSHFTFLNYLHESGRLVRFSNLGTFLPQRVEYEAYMKWAALHFSHLATYEQEGLEVVPQEVGSSHGENSSSSTPVSQWLVRSRNLLTGQIEERRARHVVLSLGGRPHIPSSFPQAHPRVIHSSQYMSSIPPLFSHGNAPRKILVIGCGQSSAEIYHDLYKRYPEAKIRLLIRGSALKPSDDSPFVNETFNPEHVDDVFATEAGTRHASILEERVTNYGVVRLELLEHIYGDMYEESVRHPSRRGEDLHARILPFRDVTSVQTLDKSDKIRAQVRNSEALHCRADQPEVTTDEVEADALIVAAGYDRNAHEDMLRGMRNLMPDSRLSKHAKWSVRRDYSVKFKDGSVSKDAGIWLQGCNESTHGLSDTLLSILAVRGGEIVDSIFGARG